MKSFKQYLKESKTDNAYIFDVDDTLVTTDAKILVKDETGNILKKLTPAEFNTYKKQPNEHLDMSEFRNEDIFSKTAKPTKYFKIIQNVSNAVKRGDSNSFIYILTARGNDIRNALYNYFKNNGIIVRPIEIHTIGDNTNKSIAELKKDVLQKIRNKHVGDVTFFDDDEKNIVLANQVKGINARLVKKDISIEEKLGVLAAGLLAGSMLLPQTMQAKDKINTAITQPATSTKFNSILNVILKHEGLIAGQTPFRITNPEMRKWNKIHGFKIDKMAEKPTGRENFLFLQNPSDVSKAVKKQFENYANNPTRYGLPQNVSLKDALAKFDQSGVRGKISYLLKNIPDLDLDQPLKNYI